MTILFAPEAEEDFAALVGYLAERNPTAAAQLGRRIFAAHGGERGVEQRAHCS